MAKSKSKSELSDSLANTLADSINKQFKGQALKTAFFLAGDNDAPTHVTEFISSGCSMLDLAISNRPNGGFPVGRITEVTGLEASGKSLLAAHTLAETQKRGGLAVYIDTEAATSAEFLEAIGADLKTMLYVPLETIEEIFETIETIVEGVRKSDKDRLVTIVVDSIMGASTKIEMAAEYDKDGYATSKSIILSKAMRKVTNWIARERICLIFTNQLRTKLGVSFGDQWTTAGGKAIPFHASVRLRLKNTGQIKAKINGVEQIVGSKTNVQVVKNRIGPPHRKVDYEIYYDSGIDNYGGWLAIMKTFDIVTQAGAHYTLQDVDHETGESFGEVKFQSKNFIDKVINVPEIKERLYNRICDAYIFKYQAGIDGGIDDVIITDEVIDEEG
ncbi:RecA RecA/RadA recombinase [uncultured Caudovirales phage]|jgi:recombination protein RecA|uniref:RecA RecA/RadA recombinase n=1 Tax=uncultured Caudovirales phage TaxID=2100421 RepID=A0A6J5PS87_9CAUD|nr:RecA RecA/RadA recombinase [uncultured Caudovirales phage]CAB4170354.1 RecA RecA/RadA recombinase [uncultured Caudovirales phage]CAB4198658.1 RecA RecA/RadA recombinase [uncultured Caudovirales phage]